MNAPTVRMFDYLQQYQAIEHEVLDAVKRVLRSGDLILASEVQRFEENFSAWLGPNVTGVGVANGTDAIVICLKALGVGDGDEVITVANTAVPTVSAIRMAGAIPVFVDVDPETALMDLKQVSFKITEKTRAIIAVHLFGNAVDMPALMAIAKQHRLWVIEDCAQSQGTTLNGQMTGSFGHAAAFSFYPTKNLGAYGDGGLCASSDPEIVKAMRSIRKYGFEDQYYAEREGINSRLDELHAAILNVKLQYLPAALSQRRSLAKAYRENLPATLHHFAATSAVEHAYHLFVVRAAQRDSLRKSLADQGIQTGIHYPFPIHLMRGYQFLGYKPGDLPVTEALGASILSLPMYPELSEADVHRVLDCLHETLD